jgi:hypothetical protein
MKYVFDGIIEASDLRKHIKQMLIDANLYKDDYDYTTTTIEDLITMYNNLNDDKIVKIN